jgi:type IV secretory pathway VirB10-like protein
MRRLLANQVKLQGLSKHKIILVGVVVSILFLLAMLLGIFSDNSATPSILAKPTDNSYVANDSSLSIKQVIDQSERNKASLTASAVADLKSLVPATASGPKMAATPTNPLGKVPPIIPQDVQRLQQKALQAKERFALSQVANKYTSFTARTLMYSSKLNQADSRADKVTAWPVKPKFIPSVASNTHNQIASSISATNNLSSSITSEGPELQEKAKLSTVEVAAINKDYLPSWLQPAKSSYEVKAGSIIPATMINGLNSDLSGQIIAQVRQNVYDSITRRYRLIPQGARLVGIYDAHIIYGQERVLVAWNRLIYPDGSSINLKAMPGSDLEGYAGFHDQVNNKYWKLFGASFIMGVITAGMQYSQNNANAPSGAYNPNPTIGQTIAGGLGQQLGQTGLAITQKNLNVQPTLIIRPNYPFNIMITADMILKPYGVGKR